MDPASPLARLAAALGIEPGFHDIWGTWHALGETTAHRLLTAMGIDAHDDPSLEAALKALHDTRWMALLPHVCVRHLGEAPWIPLSMAASSKDKSIAWRLTEECGMVHEGRIAPGELEVLEESEIDGQTWRRRRFVLPVALPAGYHEIAVTYGRQNEHGHIIVTPGRCHPPPAPEDGRGRAWGVALQLYGVRSARNWGIGDLGDLANAATLFGGLGADLIAINPLHALYADEPERASPYSPSARCFANPLYLDIEAIPDFRECAPAVARVAETDFQTELQRLRDTALVDYAAVATLKWPLLADIYAHFRERHLSPETERGMAFRRFQHDRGPALRRFAVFETLHATMGSATWSDEYLDPESPAVTEFARNHAHEIEYHEYLQWILDAQIDHVREAARASGMRIGLYCDLAVGSDAFGADVWGSPDAYARDVSIGAPPDDFNLQGQVWGLPPWRPDHLEQTAYADYVAALRANMRLCGALRIDHVIGLMRLFWVPAGASAADGAFVRYPLQDLLAILALESVRAGCAVIGEDLGTVPDELRAALYDYGLLAYRVLYFSKHWHSDHSFLAPQEFPAQALITIGTHDLPTLAGYWRGHDLQLREALQLFPDDETRDRLYAERELDRTRLLAALEHEGLQPESIDGSDPAEDTDALAAAVHRYAARSECALMVAQMEDILGQIEQANVPGTVQEQPNWRRRLDLPLEQWSHYAPLLELAEHLTKERAGHGRA